jgi:hypothetical protein
VDAVAPGLIGLGLWFCYEAWTSHTTGSAPHPIAKAKAFLTNSSSGSTTNISQTAPAAQGSVTVNPNTGQAYVGGYPVKAQ